MNANKRESEFTAETRRAQRFHVSVPGELGVLAVQTSFAFIRVHLRLIQKTEAAQLRGGAGGYRMVRYEHGVQCTQNDRRVPDLIAASLTRSGPNSAARVASFPCATPFE